MSLLGGVRFMTYVKTFSGLFLFNKCYPNPFLPIPVPHSNMHPPKILKFISSLNSYWRIYCICKFSSLSLSYMEILIRKQTRGLMVCLLRFYKISHCWKMLHHYSRQNRKCLVKFNNGLSWMVPLIILG